MSPRTSSTPDDPTTPEDESGEPTDGEPTDGEATEATGAPTEVPEMQRQMNEVMDATRVDEEPATVYPPGADVLNEENVRRYPDLFTDEQKATVSTDELPETDLERQQREAAEKAEAAAEGD